MQPSGRQPLVFGRFLLDFENELLTRDGEPVRLRPKAFAILAHLAASAGRLATKDQLLDAVWPGVFVGDAALKTCMREIRDALGDDARQPTIIETAHRRGYRFIARVDAVDRAADQVMPTSWVMRPASRTHFPIAAPPRSAASTQL
jgi:DNA-binding winged helix-turn-helix (wHTH) protein